MVAEVCEQLNLTSDDAKSRVGRQINRRYRRVTSSIGLQTSRFTQVSKTATIGNQSITFTGIEKIIAVIDKTSGIDIPISQVTVDELHITPLRSEPPRHFAVTNTHATTVTIKLDCIPSNYGAQLATIVSGGTGYTINDILTLTGGTFTEAGKFKVITTSSGVITGVIPVSPGTYTVDASNPVSTTGGTGSGATFTITFGGLLLYADGHVTVATLNGSNTPDFPESFHDVLVFGAMADEYRKMEKLQFAQTAEADFERRLSDLRMWIAKSAYLDIYQGRYSGKTFRWTRDAQTTWDT